MPNMTLNCFGESGSTFAKINIKPATIYNNIINRPKYNMIFENEMRFGILSLMFCFDY